MPVFRDSTNREIFIDTAPQRIVSLIPGITELLFDLGLNDCVVGVSDQCRYPEVRVRHKPKVGNFFAPNVTAIIELAPDLLFVDSDLTPSHIIEQFLSKGIAVYNCKVTSLESAFALIRRVGEITDKIQSANWIAETTEKRFQKLAGEQVRKSLRQRALTLIDRKPWVVAGKGTLLNSLMEATGFVNAGSFLNGHGELSDLQLSSVMPELLLLSSAPAEFSDRDVPVLKRLCGKAEFRFINSELMGWYGSRLLRTPDYLRQLRISFR